MAEIMAASVTDSRVSTCTEVAGDVTGRQDQDNADN